MSINLTKKSKYILWIGISIVIGIFIAFLATKSAGYEKVQKFVDELPSKNEILENKPELFYFIKDQNQKLEVGAEAYFVANIDTGEIIFKKNEKTVFPIASVSKLFTASVSTENQKEKEVATISDRALKTYGENGGFYLNEKIQVRDLTYPLLLESSNDAAEAIAEYFGRENFIEKMNTKVKDLGMSLTSFKDPSGLSEENKSTASDLFKFAQYLKTNRQDLLQISTKRSLGNQSHTWFNTSQFLDFEGYIGGKRGYIDEAKQTALSIFSIPLGEVGTQNIAIIILRSDDRLKDTKNIYNYLRKNVYYGLESDADLAWVKQKEGVIEPTQLDFVTLNFLGDMMLDRGVRNSVVKNFNGDYSLLFKNLSILKKADITFANMEGPASDKGKDAHNLYSFRMNPSVIPAFSGAGIKVVSIANNHMGDWGRDAYIDTLSRLKENEILYTGGGLTKIEAETPKIIEQNGIKIGYLGFSDVGPNWMNTENNQPGILLASDPRFEEIVSNASKQVDHLIVTFHFGDEYKKVHNKRQEYLAHKSIDNGAKIVIGHHPHVTEDTEVYKNGFIAYSLGNFIFDQYFSVDTMQGMFLEMKLSKNGSLTIKKNTIKLNKAFQPETIVFGKEEKIKFTK